MQYNTDVKVFTKAENRLYELLIELNYHSICDLINDNLHLPLNEIAEKIYKTNDHAKLDNLCFVLEREAIRTNKQRETSKIMLVYYLHKYNVNWTRKTKSIENRMAAFCSLRELFSNADDSYEDKIKKIWDYLEYRVPPQYHWIPETPNDPIITEAYDKYWPV